MSFWATYRVPKDGTIHVAPCDETGRLLKPHKLRGDCPCKPRVDVEQVALVIHRDPKRSDH